LTRFFLGSSVAVSTSVLKTAIREGQDTKEVHINTRIGVLEISFYLDPQANKHDYINFSFRLNMPSQYMPSHSAVYVILSLFFKHPKVLDWKVVVKHF